MRKITRKPTGELDSRGNVVYKLAFCATGAGGGVDNSCGKGGDGKFHLAPEPAKAAALTHAATALSKKANAGSSPELHRAAATAHKLAAVAQRVVGNRVLAYSHDTHAAQHTSKATGMKLAFCATGAGGGTDNSCSSKSSELHDKAMAATRRAEKGGGDDKNEAHMHSRAAQAHRKAAVSFKAEGKTDMQQKHADYAKYHGRVSTAFSSKRFKPERDVLLAPPGHFDNES